jgi:hypothetical protein
MQPLFIGPFTDKSGVRQNVTPFMTPDQAFPNLLNAFVFRGRVQRKAGYELLGRLRRVLTAQALGNTDGAGAFSANLLTIAQLIDAGATIAPGSISITVTGAPSQVFTEPATPNGTLVGSPGTGNGTINYLTGAITIQTNPALAVAAVTATFGYYPNLPAMGIREYEDQTSVNQERTVFWDTKYAYEFTSDFFELPSTIPTVWTGADKDQFWTTNYFTTATDVPLLWATNGIPTDNGFVVVSLTASVAGPPSTTNVTTLGANTFVLNDVVAFFQMSTVPPSVASGTTATVTVAGNPFTVSNPAAGVFTNSTPTVGMVYLLSNTDGIRYYDNVKWNQFTPALDGILVGGILTRYLLGSLLIVPYKNRLVVLNTFEGVTGTVRNFKQRARWSQIGDPTDVTNGWRDDLPGRGNSIDAATNEEIISCGFVKDELIVYFERSTWKLAYTGNEIGPFIWQRINSELGAESTFSAVQFDAGLVALGNVGIHTCNGSQVVRIDDVIPNEVFDIHNGTDGPERVSGIRDFYQEIVYFAYPDDERNTSAAGKIFFPDKMVIYNYKNDTFSFFDDNATTFGYFQQITGTPWSKMNVFPWNAWNIPWNSGVLDAGFPSVCFGNQQGFIEQIDPEISYNGPSLAILTLIPDVDPSNPLGSRITSTQHNLRQGTSYIRISNTLGLTNANGLNFQVFRVIDENTFTIKPTIIAGVPTAITGTYAGNGLLTVLTNINISTKQFTPLWEKGKNYSLKYIDVLVDRTGGGELQTDVYVDFNTTDSMTNNAYMLGSSTLSTAPEGTNLPYYQFQPQGQQVWKRFYTLATGETFQTKFSFSDTQMLNTLINESNVVIHAMVFFFEEAGEFY